MIKYTVKDRFNTNIFALCLFEYFSLTKAKCRLQFDYIYYSSFA